MSETNLAIAGQKNVFHVSQTRPGKRITRITDRVRALDALAAEVAGVCRSSTHRARQAVRRADGVTVQLGLLRAAVS